MNNVRDITAQLEERGRRVRGPLDNGGGPPDDPLMEARIKKLEDDLSAMKTDIAVVRSNYATKEDIRGVAVDLHKELNAQTWKLVTFVCSFGTALVAATYYIVNHAVK